MATQTRDVGTPRGSNLGIVAAIMAAAAIFHPKSEHSLLLCLMNTPIVNLVLYCHRAGDICINGRGGVLSGIRYIPISHLVFWRQALMPLRLALNSFCSQDNLELLILPPLSLKCWDYRSAQPGPATFFPGWGFILRSECCLRSLSQRQELH